MKLFVNVLSFILFLFAMSSINPVKAQEQQRPSQRPFASVLAKIKEKQSARNRERQQLSQPEDKVPPPVTRTAPVYTAHRTVPKLQRGSVATSPSPDPALLPSRQPMKIPKRPPGH